MTHTPGPWTYRPQPDGPRFFIDGQPGTKPNVKGEKVGPPIGEVFTEEDARLIIAAPKMLAALKYLASDSLWAKIQTDDEEVKDLMDRHIRAARAALKIAEG